jgi:hypothetical protein
MFSEHRDMAAAIAFFESAEMVTGIPRSHQNPKILG